MWRTNKIRDQLNWAEKQLAKMGIQDGRIIARVLMEHALAEPGEMPKSYALRHREDETIEKSLQNKFRDFIFRRMRGELTSRIVGYREFWSLPFKLNAATMDPRPDTETLVETVLKRLGEMDPEYKTRNWRIFDMGAGTGCIIISLLYELNQASGFACDISFHALEATAENAAVNGVAPRLSLFSGDWSDAVLANDAGQKFDVVTSNPPYVAEYYRAMLSEEVLGFDPPASLWGGPLGLDAYCKIIPAMKNLLKPSGFGILEIGADQADSVAQIAVESGLRVADVVRDLAGHRRGVVVQMP